jgi:hypothetical protein
MLFGLTVSAANAAEGDVPDALAIAAEVDELILAELRKADVEPAGRTNDEDLLRRVYLDLAGRLPTPQETTSFGLDTDPEKRSKIIDQSLASEGYAENWARYWRDVIFADPAEMQSRLMAGTFETWMKDQLQQNRSWDQITTDLLTATGNVERNGATALLVAHSGDPAEVAADVSRIFLGIQLECANCHDHPTDKWKREQFHQLAAYFPRAEFRVRRADGGLVREVVSVNAAPLGRSGDRMFENPEGIVRRLDRNGDGLLSRSEASLFSPIAKVFDRLLEAGDANEDGSLTAEEMKKIPPPPDQAGRSTPEYLMPDLYDPASGGTLVHPTFFLDGSRPGIELDDLTRRQSLADSITSPDNPWFARAVVNRVWTEMLGDGFYASVDDLGPEREVRFPEALQALTDGFTASGYDVQWLLRTIANTEAYQRQIRDRAAGEEALPFASALPTRLRSDQIYTALTQALEIEESAGTRTRRGRGPYANLTPRNSFHLLFAADPSTPREDVTGNVPQALFLMNSPALRDYFAVEGSARLARLLEELPGDGEAIVELYLVTLCRRPSSSEERVCLEYVAQVGNRSEAFEDLLWGLLNSAEFVSRR